MSHPMWVRGLKQRTLCIFIPFNRSHPMWVRGLKHELAIACRLSLNVAPHVGAWIETPHESPSSMPALRSHPMWVRGLKLLTAIAIFYTLESHPMWVRGLKRHPLPDGVR